MEILRYKTISLGEVKSLVCSTVVDGKTLLTQQLGTTLKCVNGDSGGVVYIPGATSNKIVGILVSRSTSNDSPTTAYVTYAIQIGAVLGVYPY